MKLFNLSILFLISFNFLSAQPQATIVSYNLLNYPGTDTTTRNPYLRTTLSNIQPDILVVQEMTSQAGVDGILYNVLRSFNSDYSSGTFINGPDTDNAIFFRTSKFQFVANNPIKTALRDINEFIIVHNLSQDTLRIYSVHLKASTGTTNENQRAAEIDSLRKRTNALTSGSNFIVLGDFNIYESGEPAYQKIISQSQPGYFIDINPLTGTWNNSAYAQYHTQSPRTISFGGGATGGMDDRFDMILFSQSLINSGGITYNPGTYTEFGNDGQHFNDSINRPPNNAVGQQIADALHYASDHIPVFASFTFEGSSVQISVNVSVGWNLLSVPVSAINMSAASLFPTATTSFFSYVDGYQVDSILMNGKGYWAKFDAVQNVLLTGSLIDSSDITVRGGWNLIGPFSADIPVASITTTPGNILASSFFGYNLGYEQANTLLKGKGYWIRTTQNGILHLNQ